MFWIAPLIGAALAGAAYRWLSGEKRALAPKSA
jgi:glycerol uptake facilitator-like aquaporin